MNSISEQLIPRIFASGQGARNPLTEAALVLAGVVSNDLSDAALQSAIADVEANALSSQNPAVWIAALLIDLAGSLTDWENRIIDLEVNGGGGGSGTFTLHTGAFISMSETTGSPGDWWEDTVTAANVGYIFLKLANHRWVAIAKGDALPV